MHPLQTLMSALLISACITSFADDHMENLPGVAQVFECTLNENISPGDVVTFGSEKVAKFADEQNLSMNSYLWEAVAVNDPYSDPDVRWVNYYPSWGEIYKTQAAFDSEGAALVDEFYSMLTCEKPVLLASQNLMSDLVIAEQKPMIAAVCQLHEDKTTLDGMKFNKQSVDIANETLGTKIGASVFIPAFGISGFDYVGTFYGETSDMAKLMDSVRDRTLPAKFAAAGMEPVADCVNDLHTSHLMINRPE